MRIPLALVALLLLLAGAWQGRCAVATRLKTTFEKLAEENDQLSKEPGARARALLERSEEDARREMLGAGLLGAGCLLVLVAGAAATRANASLAAAAFLVGLLATGIDVRYPSARVPGIATVQPPSDEWPYGAVRHDPNAWQAFIIISNKSGQQEWTGLVGDNELGPDGLAKALEKRLAKSKRPVALWSDKRCPRETRQVFADAVAPVAKASGVAFEELELCDPADFGAKRKQIHEDEMGDFREIALFSSLSRFAWALALGVLVWSADVRTKGMKGVSLLAGGQLVLALGQVVALPVLLYIGMLPEEKMYRNPFERFGENAQLYEWLLFASSALVALGALATTAGELMAPDLPRELPPSGGPSAAELAEQIRAKRAARAQAASASAAPAPADPAPAAPAPVNPAPASTPPSSPPASGQASEADVTRPPEGSHGGG